MKTLKRRKRENKTNYLKRLKLLKSETPRIVFRKTNKYVIAQYVTNNQTVDKIELGVNSRDLMKHGWPKEFQGSLKSIPASYLVGYLIGKKIKDKKLKEKIIKQLSKIKENQTLGKPMQYSRKGTRELHIAPFRLSYYCKDNEVWILDLYHKNSQ